MLTPPTLPDHLANQLTHDPDHDVKAAATANPALPRTRLVELLHHTESARSAAANPILPAKTLHHLYDLAGLP